MSVNTTDVLAWLQKSIETHQSHAAQGRSSLFAVWLAEREKWMPLIAEVIRAEDGVVVDSTGAGADWVESGEVESEAPALVTAINVLLDHFNREQPDAGLRLDFDSGRCRVAGAQDYVAANAAQKAIRDIATALTRDVLRESEFVAFAYSEASLEYAHTSLVWTLVRELPGLLKMTTGTVMVMSCEGQIKVDIHCSGDPSLVARVTSDGIAWRHPWAKSLVPLQTVGRQDSDAMPMFVLFLGAGASMGFGLPSGDNFRNDVLSRLTEMPVDEGTFESVVRSWWNHLRDTGQLSDVELATGEDAFVETLTLEVVLEHEQQEESQRFSSSLGRFARQHANTVARIRAAADGDDPIRKLVSLRHRLVLVTVNFDQVIEARCESDDIKSFATEQELIDFPAYLDEYLKNGGAVPLLKIHGDITKPETIVANISRTSAGLTSARFQALQYLIESMHPNQFRPWWYVGYSMRDRDLDTIWKDPRFYGFQERWISPFADANVEAFIRASRIQGWNDQQLPTNNLGDRLITWTADDFFEQLYATVGSRWTGVA